MEIYEEVLDLIAEVAEKASDHEIGGMLGADRSGSICQVVVDHSSSNNRHTYVPNVDWLNNIIAQWENWNFSGLFHTHLNNQKTLSCGDRKYIKEILMAMPSDVTYLYFPLHVLPENKFYAFKAERINDEIIITEESVHII